MNRFIKSTHCVIINSPTELYEFLDLAKQHGLKWCDGSEPHEIGSLGYTGFPISMFHSFCGQDGMSYDSECRTLSRKALMMDDLSGSAANRVSPVPLDLSFLTE